MQLSKKQKAILAVAGTAGLAYGVIPTVIGKTRYMTRHDRSEKTIYLTFDDGPSQYTSDLLDLLAEHDVKATFFMVGTFAAEYPETVRRVMAEGHQIGVHSLEHRSALISSPAYTNRDFHDTVAILRNLGADPKYYRPPWGEVNLWSLMNMDVNGLKKVIWNVMAEDWRGNTTADIIAEKLLNRTKNGDVVCLHDGRGKNNAPLRTIEALKQVIPIWKDEGYEFKLIDD
ncbi:polysaccharide deacetylase family protein [Aminicella lysinilytica]|uniref:polysaccharide deacetylase family protein n=1 Tax=Aminicella lysinilytica TaxID=433323 RepID=UPI0026ED2E36|nr:polysaccharide deacetylase family protein [Aminicella lysinilytica]